MYVIERRLLSALVNVACVTVWSIQRLLKGWSPCALCRFLWVCVVHQMVVKWSSVVIRWNLPQPCAPWQLCASLVAVSFWLQQFACRNRLDVSIISGVVFILWIQACLWVCSIFEEVVALRTPFDSFAIHCVNMCGCALSLCDALTHLARALKPFPSCVGIRMPCVGVAVKSVWCIVGIIKLCTGVAVKWFESVICAHLHKATFTQSQAKKTHCLAFDD